MLFKTRQVYRERLDNYVRNFHVNQVNDLEELAATPNVVSVLEAEPVSKESLKNKQKNKKDNIQPSEILIQKSASGENIQIPIYRPSWKVDKKYSDINTSGHRIHLSTHDNGFERDSL
jgi:hypothetical protein